MTGYLVKCTAAALDTLYVGPFTTRDAADEFARDPRVSANRHHVDDWMASVMFNSYEREVVTVYQP
jgi:hypothetical protein